MFWEHPAVIARTTAPAIAAVNRPIFTLYLVEQKIDKLATDGRITQEQADILKAAARKSYADLQKRLKELSVADIEVSAEK